MPLGHLGINVPHLAAAQAYYDELMPLLSFEPVPFLDEREQFACAPSGGKVGAWLFFYPALENGADSRHRAGLQHLAFMVKTRAEVDALHEWALVKGSEVVHRPKEWPEYRAGYYATFWLDLHGLMLEAVCHRGVS